MTPAHSSLPITIFSFGYKYEPPQDVNLLFDVRFLANPYHVETLRSFTGLEPSIAEYVLKNESGRDCLQHLHRVISFFAEQYQLSGKKELRVAIGCTGGHHRSVAMTEALALLLRKESDAVDHFHRDIRKESH
ncbi:MAG: hypothetical protein KKD01_05020 [Proteobacteria bacterium]|nr:hypothetical protein [Pseudomonadota bacterium]MBU1416915.1 hypothetical protein [Pseudomonadota bacterium]MBU1454071.1 hypothetical protein [Pseudomonadota bacterium]